MSCEKLRNGLKICDSGVKNYEQSVVLINRADVLNSQILTSTVDVNDNYNCRYGIAFNLKPNLKGFSYSITENSDVIFGTYEMSRKENIPQYKHSVTLPIVGTSQSIKCILKQIDNSDYFAALRLKDGTIEIYGFEFGLTNDTYNYDVQNSDGGAILKLTSNSESFEDELPFIYLGNSIDFDNLFLDLPFVPRGDFNDDFNNDFNNF